MIRESNEPNYDPSILCEEKIIDAVTMTGESHKNDSRLVHQIFLRNVSEESNAYTYIKPLLRHRDDRRDFFSSQGKVQ